MLAASAGAPQLLQEPSESVANIGLPSCPSKLLAVSSAALIYNARSAVAVVAVAVVLRCIRYDSGQPCGIELASDNSVAVVAVTVMTVYYQQ